MLFYKIGKGLFYIYFHTFFNVECKGLNNFPQEGAVIVCSNHISALDPLLLAVALNRMVYFMGKKELFSNKFLSWLFRQLGAFPVNRQAVEMASLKHSLEILKSGKVLGIFSQATRKASVSEDDGKAGVALFAVKSGAMVVPVGISGNYKLFTKMTVKIGNPMDFSDLKDKKVRTPELTEMTKGIMAEVSRLV